MEDLGGHVRDGGRAPPELQHHGHARRRADAIANLGRFLHLAARGNAEPRRTAPSPLSTGGGARSLADSAIIHGLASAAAGWILTRSRTRSTGETRCTCRSRAPGRPVAAGSSAKTAGPMVVVATQGVHAARAQRGELEPKAAGRRAEKAERRHQMPGAARGASTSEPPARPRPRRSSRGPSRRRRRQDGGIARVTAEALTPPTAVKRSVVTIRSIGSSGHDASGGGSWNLSGAWASQLAHDIPLVGCRSVSLRCPAGAGRMALHAGRRPELLARSRRRGLRARWRLVHLTPPGVGLPTASRRARRQSPSTLVPRVSQARCRSLFAASRTERARPPASARRNPRRSRARPSPRRRRA